MKILVISSKLIYWKFYKMSTKENYMSAKKRAQF